MQTYTTQMDAARKGIITPQMECLGWPINGIVFRQRHWLGVFLMKLLWNRLMIG